MTIQSITIGQRFERLTVIAYEGTVKKHRSWKCLCDCGNTIIARGSSLLCGYNKSCGCLHGEVVRTHGLTRSPEYRAWRSLRGRCHNPSSKSYKDYGARGITVCTQWLESFENFYRDMGARPSPQHSIERIDNNKGYTPDNCRWATVTEQARNRRSTLQITYNGRTLCLAEWAIETDIHIRTLSFRLKHGWTIERALTTPVRG